MSRYPVLQVALDFLELGRALQLAREAYRGGARWIEAGTPLVKSEGLDSIRALRKEFPDGYLIADLKTMDAGRAEFESAAKAGANCATVCSTGTDSTILECIEAGRNYGIDVAVDTLGLSVERIVELGLKAEEWGAHHLGLHIPIDDQMRGKITFDVLRAVRPKLRIPLALAGGINSETAAEAVRSGADIVIVGGAITKSGNAEQATRDLIAAITRGVSIETTLYKRVSGEEEIRRVLEMVSTPNVSDALHRSGDLPGLICVTPGKRMVGPAYTVRTYPGDWAKPVEAIDHAAPGDVIVIDQGGVGPACWGELASESCLQRKIAGVLIDGAIRDVDAIRSIGFAAFAKILTPTAGEPKGFGEMQVPIKVSGVAVHPGDWIVGDESGVVRIPRARAVEIANRAMDVLEHENRIREEIRRKSTLASVAELSKWEKQIVENLGQKPPFDASSPRG
jgi:3-hexulose-6-phosphate synthase/6-phospho-3-hexuloisomerase